MVVEMLVCAVVEAMISNGTELYVMKSGNLDGSDEYNKNALEKLKKQFPELLDAYSII